MLNSMTGYGTGSAAAAGWTADVALRTLNHRYLAVRVRGIHDPELERRIESEIKHAFARGEIEVTVTLTRDPERELQLRFDQATVSRYVEALRQICDKFTLPPPGLSDLIAVGAFAPPAATTDADPWDAVAQALEQAIASGTLSRSQEGELLTAELRRITRELSGLIQDVKARIPDAIAELRDRMRERVVALGAEVDPTRLEAEIVLLAERADVREEIARLETHLTRIDALLAADGPVGKELGFLAQELLREANTLGAKSRDLAINGAVVAMKVAIDHFKEQVQNVE